MWAYTYRIQTYPREVGVIYRCMFVDNNVDLNVLVLMCQVWADLKQDLMFLSISVSTVMLIPCCTTLFYFRFTHLACSSCMTPAWNINIHNLNSNSPHSLILCLYPGCHCWFKTLSGLTCHKCSKHPTVVTPQEALGSYSNSSQHDGKDLVLLTNIYTNYRISIMDQTRGYQHWAFWETLLIISSPTKLIAST